ncbi:hypothetical protein ABPG77_000388 [Micractinium sp. CCAP 211/92]
MQDATPDSAPQLQAAPNAPAAPLLAAAPARADSAPLVRQLSQQLLLLHASSLAAAGLSGLGLSGSQDLSSLLDAGSLQGSPRSFDLDFLASPKWKAVLSWQGSASASASPRHLDSAASSGHAWQPTVLEGPAATAGFGVAGCPPEAGQQATAVDLETAWLQAAAQQAQHVLAALQVEARGLAPDEDMSAADEEVAAVAANALLPAAGRRTSGVGKKRPSWVAPSADSQPATPTAARPPSKQLRTEHAAGAAAAGAATARPPRPPVAGTSRFGLQSAAEQGRWLDEDALMVDAEAAAADAAASSVDAGAAATWTPLDGTGEDPQAGDTAAEAALLSGLSRVRLSSISTLEQRRLTAAAAAAAVGPAGRRGVRLQRGDSGVQMLVPPGLLPGSPTWGACTTEAELASGGEPGKGGPAGKAWRGSPAVRVEVKVEAGGPPALPPPLSSLQQISELPVQLPLPLPQTSAQGGGSATPEIDGDMAAAAWPAEQPVASAVQGRQRRQVLPTKSHKAVATGQGGVFTSAYRGVTRHRLTGRFEAHFWDSSYVRPQTGKKSKRTRGRQVYVGGYETELEAARAYDRAVIAYLGTSAPLNFPPEDYAEDLVWMAGRSPEEVVSILRKGSVGFARGQSQYRGVTRHQQHGKWESRLGKVDGSRYLYLGTYDTAEEAARAYDRACVKFRGTRAILNFDLSDYQDILEDPEAYDPAVAAANATACTAGASSAGAISAGASAARAAAAQAAQCPGASAAAALSGQFLAGVTLGVLPGGGMFLPLLADAAPAVWGLAGMPAMVLATQYQPAPVGAAAHQPSPLGAQHFQLPVPGGYQSMPNAGDSHQPAPMITASSFSTFTSAHVPSHAAAAAPTTGSPLLRLPAIRTRVAATVAAATAAAASGITADGTAAMAGTPATAGSADMDLAGFLLSPLAASLLSPLALAGTPGSGGWRDSPLSRFFAGGLADAGGSTSTTGQAVHFSGALGRAGGCGGGSKMWGTEAVGGQSQLLGSPPSQGDLAAALQWLDSLDPAELAELLASPGIRSPVSSGGRSAVGGPVQQAGPSPDAGAPQ